MSMFIRKIFFIVMLLIIIFCGHSYSFSGSENYLELFRGKVYPSDNELKALAVEMEIIPSDSNASYIDQEIKAKNTITMWMSMDRQRKVNLINKLIKTYKDKSEILIRQSASYYVDEINGVIWNSIKEDGKYEISLKGLGNIFKTIAIMDGDYDDGRNKVQILKEYIGEDWLKEYKENYPERYGKLFEKRQEAIEILSEDNQK